MELWTKAKNHKMLSLSTIALLIVIGVFTTVFSFPNLHTEHYSVPTPEDGFQWTFENGLTISHYGTASIPDNTGRLRESQIVVFEDDDRTDILYLTPDFRFVLLADREFSSDDGLRILAWTREDIPWLYGASEWFGATAEVRGSTVQVQWADTFEPEPFDGDLRISEGRLHIEYEVSTKWDFLQGYPRPQWSSRYGELMFQKGSAVPAQASSLKEDTQDRELILATTSIHDLRDHMEGQDLSDLPVPVNSDGFFPLHAPDWDHPFPFTEAWEQIESEVREDFIVSNILGGNSTPLETTVGGVKIGDQQFGPVVLEREWRWDITVDSPTEQPTTYRVSKLESDASSEPDYRVVEWDKDVPDVKNVGIPERMIPLDEAIRFVEQRVGAEYNHVSTFPFIDNGVVDAHSLSVALDPRIQESGPGFVSTWVEFLRFDIQTGYMMSGMFAPELRDRLLIGGPE